jgi:hypothetical protein
MEHLLKNPSIKNLPRTIAEAQKLAARNNKKFFEETGSAPWRVAQLSSMMADSLNKIKADASPEIIVQRVNAFLLYGGLLSHFIGDLAQPLHITEDYDGYLRNQGGIHKYFEEDVVSVLNLNLDYEVFAKAVKEKPFAKRIAKSLTANSNKLNDFSSHALEVAWTLSLDSFNRRDELFRIDKTLALIKPSKNVPIQLPAGRKDPEEVAEAFRDLIIERISLAADTLAHLWLEAWERAGRPQLANYQSYTYFLEPEFVDPDYWPKSSGKTP